MEDSKNLQSFREKPIPIRQGDLSLLLAKIEYLNHTSGEADATVREVYKIAMKIKEKVVIKKGICEICNTFFSSVRCAYCKRWVCKHCAGDQADTDTVNGLEFDQECRDCLKEEKKRDKKD